MAGEFSIRAVNDWRATMRTDLQTVLRVSRDVFHRTAEQATKHAIIVMAQSARALTKQSAKRRPVLRDEKGAPFVWMLHQGHPASKRYKWMAKGDDAKWERMQIIYNRGLAKRSWMWGLSDLQGDVEGYTGRGAASKPMAGVAIGYAVGNGREVVGHVVENRLAYLEAILPGGWLATVEQKATNLIMKRAEMKMVREFERGIGRRAA